MKLFFPLVLSSAFHVCLSQAEERAQFEIIKSQMYAERAAKRDRRPKRARAMPEDEPIQKGVCVGADRKQNRIDITSGRYRKQNIIDITSGWH